MLSWGILVAWALFRRATMTQSSSHDTKILEASSRALTLGQCHSTSSGTRKPSSALPKPPGLAAAVDLSKSLQPGPRFRAALEPTFKLRNPKSGRKMFIFKRRHRSLAGKPAISTCVSANKVFIRFLKGGCRSHELIPRGLCLPSAGLKTATGVGSSREWRFEC